MAEALAHEHLTLSVGGPHIVLFSPTYSTDRIILAASSTDPGAYRSTDGGATWLPVGWYSPTQPYYGGFIGGSVLALTLAPHTSYDATAFAGTSSGLYRSSNWGEYWYQRNNGLARLTVRSIAFTPTDPARCWRAPVSLSTCTWTPRSGTGRQFAAFHGWRSAMAGRFWPVGSGTECGFLA